MKLRVAPDPANGFPLAAKVARLRQAETYPEKSLGVESLETHFSWVFLTQDHAYKLKKPLHYPFLDLSGLRARRRNCQEEIRLNRRLAPDVYEGLSCLVPDREGRLQLDGPGNPVEWLVRMRRLPAERMLDRCIAQGNLSRASVQSVARLLTRFYQAAPVTRISGEAYRRRFFDRIQEHLWALARPSLGLPPEVIRRIHAAQREFLCRHGSLLEQRAVEGRVVEGHGDLRPEHICLEARPVIFDCLEFSELLRSLDPADELAFLALECRRLGAPGVGPALFATYGALTADVPPQPLIAFYQSFRACLWAQLASWRIEQGDRAHRAKWRGRAEDYLRLADRSCGDFS